ncbi:MAG: TonB-dependent receptor [Dokdonella sp.]
MLLKQSLLALALLVALREIPAAENVPEAPADVAPNSTPDETATQNLETISVIGQGETRQVQRISQDSIKLLPPGASPLKVMAELPGVNFQSADAFGNYEWSSRITLRGFNQSQLGFTLDGIPLGDMAYGNDNGLHISRALISENLGGAELAEGIGGVNTASTGNLGGTFQFYSADPLPQYGVTVAQSLGSDAARRTYARLDTGDHNGFAMYVSAVAADIDKWKGEGEQKQTQFNMKAVYDFGDNHLSLLWTSSRRNETDYQDLSLDLQCRKGWDWDNSRPDWQRAVDTAYCNPAYGQTERCPYSSSELAAGAFDWAYFDARGLRNDNLAGISGDFGLAEGVRLKVTGYYHNDRGQGHWFTPYQPSSASVPISLRTTEYGIDRGGVIAALSYEFGANHLEGGFWYEDNSHNVQRNYYFIDGPIDDGYFFHDPDIRAFYQHYQTTTRQFYLEDKIHLLDDRLLVDIGFKSPHTEVVASTVPGTFSSARANGTLDADSNFLPQVGASYKLGGGNELFASYAKNMAAFQGGVSSPLATSQAVFNAIAGKLKPERTQTFEGGFRHVDSEFEASAALYHVAFDNRLLVISQCAGIVGCPSAFANVGSVTSQGAEASVVWKPFTGLRWYNALSWNEATYDSDYLDGDHLIATKGKQTVNTPKQIFSTDLSWTQGPWELHFGANYTGRRYYTYTNDASVGSSWIANASAGYSFEHLGPVEDLRVALGVTNLFDKQTFSTIGTNGFLASDAQGQYATLLTGAPREALLTVTAKF